MFPQPAPTNFKAASMFAKVCTHWASKSPSPTSLPLPSTPTWPAMKTNSEALTRVRCEYRPSGLPSASGLRILMSAIVNSGFYATQPLGGKVLFHLDAACLDRGLPFFDFALYEVAQPLRAALVRCGNGRAKLCQSFLHRRRCNRPSRSLVELLHDIGRRAFRKKQRAPGIGLHVEALFDGGWQIRQDRRALLGHDGKAFDLLALDLRLCSRDDLAQVIDAAADKILHRRTRPFVGNVRDHRRTHGGVQNNAAEMRGGASAGRAELHLGLVFPGVGDKFLEIVYRQVRPGD